MLIESDEIYDQLMVVSRESRPVRTYFRQVAVDALDNKSIVKP